MAVVSVDIDHLNLEVLPDVLLKIGEALNERLTILKAFRMGVATNCWTPENGSPNYALQVNFLKSLTMELSKHFIDLNADYISNSYTNFPKTLLLQAKENSNTIGANCVYQGETFTEDTMDNFKSTLSTTCVWLNKMTCIRPESPMVMTMQHWSDIKRWNEATSSDLSNKTAPFSPPIEEERSGNMTITVTESLEKNFYSGSLIADGGSRSVNADVGLVIDNRTPYAAAVKCFLTLPQVAESSWNNRNKWQSYFRKIEKCSDPWTYHGSTMPGRRDVEETTAVLAGGQWREAYTSDAQTYYSQNLSGYGDNYQVLKYGDDLWQNWNHEGTENYEITSTHTEEGPNPGIVWYADPKNTIEVYDTVFWYDVGSRWADVRTPYETTLPAHTKDYVISGFSTFPEPIVNWHQFDGSYTRGSYDWEEDYTFDYKLRVVPILDFTDSITTFSGV